MNLVRTHECLLWDLVQILLVVQPKQWNKWHEISKKNLPEPLIYSPHLFFFSLMHTHIWWELRCQRSPLVCCKTLCYQLHHSLTAQKSAILSSTCTFHVYNYMFCCIVCQPSNFLSSSGKGPPLEHHSPDIDIPVVPACMLKLMLCCSEYFRRFTQLIWALIKPVFWKWLLPIKS